ncbi:hypothetical protein LXL04_001657 [Taraxacum kok-saghyz]
MESINSKVEVKINDKRFMIMVGDEEFTPWFLKETRHEPSEDGSDDEEDWDFRMGDDDFILDDERKEYSPSHPANSPVGTYTASELGTHGRREVHGAHHTRHKSPMRLCAFEEEGELAKVNAGAENLNYGSELEKDNGSLDHGGHTKEQA